MAKVKMIADAKQLYDGKVVRSGDRFTVANEKDADDLVATKFARRDTSEYETRVMTAGKAADAPAQDTAAPAAKRSYRTRVARVEK